MREPYARTHTHTHNIDNKQQTIRMMMTTVVATTAQQKKTMAKIEPRNACRFIEEQIIRRQRIS